jgi:NitT/TauT family transport system substrate-binding protein
MSQTTRREFANGMALTAGAAILGLSAKPANAEPPPETTRLTLPKFPFDHACLAPQWIADELLRAEGFTDIQYRPVRTTTDYIDDLAAGKLDFGGLDAMSLLLSLDAGKRFVAIAGIHVGCFELFGTSQVRSLLDLKNRTVAVGWAGGVALVTAMATYVGFDPRRDSKLVQPPNQEAIRLLADGKIDGLLGFPPDPQELRTRKIGHVVVSTTEDRPWSQYFCCMAVTNVNFAKKYPVATKRMLRAFTKATDMCALEPDRVARSLVDRGFVKNHAYALQTLKEIPYTKWREYDPADTMRFYALRLHETGMIKASPQTILARGTDWRAINELKKELKA